MSSILTLCKEILALLRMIFSPKFFSSPSKSWILYKRRKYRLKIQRQTEETRRWIAHLAKVIPDDVLHLVGQQ